MPQGLRLVKDGAGNNVDLFAGVEDGSYSEDKCYIRATDGQGHSETKYIKFSGPVLGQIGELVSSKVVAEYRTEADFIRDAVIHRLKYWNGRVKSGDLENTLNRAVALNNLLANQLEIDECIGIVNTYEDSLQKCRDNRDWPMMQNLLVSAESMYEDLRPAYQERLRKTIDKYAEDMKNR